MTTKKKYKVIFLDFDGVRNGSGPLRYILWRSWKIFKFLKLEKIYDKIFKEDVYGVHERKVKRLATICHITDARVVLSSSWRDRVYEVINTGVLSIVPDANKLAELFQKYNIEVIGCTNHSFDGVRQKEILDWLSRNEDNVEDFIILDDEWEDLELLTYKLILTSDATPNRPILGCWYCRDGLRFIHVIKSIKMLGIKNIKRRNNQNEQS